MKALTIWQPWASLIAWEEKQFETRSWKTDYRGPLAIHANLSDSELDVVESNIFYRSAFKRHGNPALTRLPFGMVLCVVDLIEIVHTEDLKPWLSPSEEAFGDYSTGRFAWKLDNLRLLAKPIQARGHQGLWEFPRTIEELEFMT